MSCIIAVKRNGVIVFGSDSLVSTSYNKYSCKNDKIFYKGKTIIGVAGSPRVGQLIQYELKDFKIKSNDQTEMEYMVKIVAQSIKTVLEENNACDPEEFPFEVLIGYNGKLYQMFNDFQIVELDYPYQAVGSGSDIAIGSLFTSSMVDPDVDLMTMVQRGLTAASMFDKHVGGDFKCLILDVRARNN